MYQAILAATREVAIRSGTRAKFLTSFELGLCLQIHASGRLKISWSGVG
jgi:hypothetical protein